MPCRRSSRLQGAAPAVNRTATVSSPFDADFDAAPIGPDWCGWPDSNRQGLSARRILSSLWLPFHHTRLACSLYKPSSRPGNMQEGQGLCPWTPLKAEPLKSLFQGWFRRGANEALGKVRAAPLLNHP